MVGNTKGNLVPSSLIMSKLKEQANLIPSYGEREGWIPRNLQDYGDGGAFPEIHIPQFPLNMGREIAKLESKSIVPFMTDSKGKTRYDAIVQYGHRPGEVVHSRPSDMLGKKFSQEELAKPDEKEIKDNTARTKQALESKLSSIMVKTNASSAPEGTGNKKAPQLVRYTPSTTILKNMNAPTQRLVKIVEQQIDPLEPPKFKISKTVPINSEAPVPILHDAPKKATKEDIEAWVIPPSLSNWNNSRGFTISLDKRLATEGRGLQEIEISSRFATMAAALDSAQQSAREQVAFRARLEEQKLLKQREQEAQKGSEIARIARLRRAGILMEAEETETIQEKESRLSRDAVRNELRLDQEDELRRSRMGSKTRSSTKNTTERDISEKIALGQTVPRTQESLYDQRLFNQTQGLDHGWTNDEDYTLYDKPLLTTGREEALYRAPQRDGEMYSDLLTLDKISKFDRFKADKPFNGSDNAEVRSGPVEFERDEDEALHQKREELERINSLKSHDKNSGSSSPKKEEDPMDTMLSFMSDAKSSRKRDRNENSSDRQTLGRMHAVGGSSGTVQDYKNLDSKHRRN